MKAFFIDRGANADLYVNPNVTDIQYSAIMAYLNGGLPLPVPVPISKGKVLASGGLVIHQEDGGGPAIGGLYAGSIVNIEAKGTGAYCKVTAWVSNNPAYILIT